MSYISFTQEQKREANEVDLECYLQARGERLLPSGREKRLDSRHSITIRGNTWYDHATCQGGKSIRFLQYYDGLSYPEAVAALLNSGVALWLPPQEEPKVPFEPPEANRTVGRVFAYLTQTRCIDREVVAFFAHRHLIYEDLPYHNVVFAGLDETGVMRHAQKRSTNTHGKAFKQNVAGSDPRYSFHYLGDDGLLYVFEGPIDLLSFVTLFPNDWEQHSYLACCGTSTIPLEWVLDQKNYEQVYLCFDNDPAGLSACQRAEEVLARRDIYTRRLLPVHKDWNEDLKERVKSC